MPAQVTFHLSDADKRSLASQTIRAELRAGLDAHRARMRAARIMDEQRTERRAVREAQREALEQRRNATALERAAMRQQLEVLTAKRRDQYRSALAYPMTPAELLRAAIDACDSAKLPADQERDDTISEVVRIVIRRHGRAPLRCDVGADGLRQLAQMIYLREQRKREHKTGMRKAAAQLSSWHSADLDAARAAGDSGPDAVWYRAMSLPAPTAERDPLNAAQLRERLQLTARQAQALEIAVRSRKRVTLALSGPERKAATDARRILRERFPSAEALLVALRGPSYAAQLATDRAQLIERKRASSAALGSHLPGASVPMAAPMLPVWRPGDQRMTPADRVWTYGLTARDDRAAR